MSTGELIRINLLSPYILAFVLGIAARRVKSDLRFPPDLYAALSIYLLFAIGLKGGVALSETPLRTFLAPAAATLVLGIATPLIAYAILRRIGRFGRPDAAGMAAHYGSVSAVTFIAATEFARAARLPAEPFLPTLLAFLEIPGIFVALGFGRLRAGREAGAHGSLGAALREVAVGRTMILLAGGLVIGYATGPTGYAPIAPFFTGGFNGALTLFLLEMGLLAGERLGDLRRVGGFLIGFGMLVPVLHGALGALLGTLAGLDVGGAAVLATMAASASYIAAPPAVRLTFPEANATYYLTAAIAITFPFNLIVGIPLYFQFARLLGGA